jgi:RHS repeat-associated protein
VGLKVCAFDETTYTGYNKTADSSGSAVFTLPLGSYRFRADKHGTQFWSGEANHCVLPGCTTTVVTTTVPVLVSVEDGGGDPEPGLKVYAFDETTYTGFNGTTDAAGVVTMTLPVGGYRFRADKDGVQYWSGSSNHCTVPSCTEVTISTGAQAKASGGAAMASNVPVADVTLLAIAPLAVLSAFGRRRRGRYVAWPLATAMFVVAAISFGLSAANTGVPLVAAAGPSEIAPLSLAALPGLEPASSPAEAITTTRTISYTYDALNRLTGAGYSTGEVYGYEYDAVGNRTVMTDTVDVHSYTYESANRLTSADGVAYTWDARGNLTGDGTFTYEYNGAGRMVRAESVTATVAYTYTAAGSCPGGSCVLRAVQSADGATASFTWDWASTIPEAACHDDTLYLVGHETLGHWDGARWAYYMPDALGSGRQERDSTGSVVAAREWTPYGTGVGVVQEGPGYSGEWWDVDVLTLYLRARWYDPYPNRFVTPDSILSDHANPQSLNGYAYVGNNALKYVDPSGHYYGDFATYCHNNRGDPYCGVPVAPSSCATPYVSDFTVQQTWARLSRSVADVYGWTFNQYALAYERAITKLQADGDNRFPLPNLYDLCTSLWNELEGRDPAGVELPQLIYVFDPGVFETCLPRIPAQKLAEAYAMTNLDLNSIWYFGEYLPETTATLSWYLSWPGPVPSGPNAIAKAGEALVERHLPHILVGQFTGGDGRCDGINTITGNYVETKTSTQGVYYHGGQSRSQVAHDGASGRTTESIFVNTQPGGSLATDLGSSGAFDVTVLSVGW